MPNNLDRYRCVGLTGKTGIGRSVLRATDGSLLKVWEKVNIVAWFRWGKVDSCGVRLKKSEIIQMGATVADAESGSGGTTVLRSAGSSQLVEQPSPQVWLPSYLSKSFTS